jgi:hypothetical protein
MTVRQRRPRPGDLVTVSLGEERTAHLYYVGKHPAYGDAIYVLDSSTVPHSPTELKKLIAASYLTFYPLTAAVAQNLVRIEAHHDLQVPMPRKLRRAGARAADGKVLTWVIEDESKESVCRALSPAQRALPIAAIWSHDLLCSRIRSQWRPENEYL